MKQKQIWSLTGVAPEAQERAREAAQREGISVGDWLQRRLIDERSRDRATPELHGEPAREAQPAGTRDSGSLRRRPERAPVSARLTPDSEFATRRIDEAVNAMAHLLESNERSQNDTSRVMSSLASEINAAARDQASAFQELNQRIDRIERDSDTATLQEAVRNLGHGLSRLTDQSAHSLAETTGQIHELADTLEALDGKIASARGESQRLGMFIQEQLSTFAERVRSAEAGMARIPHVESSIDALGKRVAEFEKIESSIAELGKFDAKAAEEINTLANGLEALANQANAAQGETNRLAERLSAAEFRMASYPRVEGTVESLSKRIAGLDQIEQTIGEFGKRANAAAAQISTLAGTLGTHASEIASAREASMRLDVFVREQARILGERLRTAESVMATYPRVEETVERLSARIAALGQVENSIAELGQRDAEVSAQLAALSGNFRTLGERVASAEGTIATYSDIEAAVAKLNRRANELGERDAETSAQVATLGETMRTLGSEISSARDISNKLSGRIASAEGTIANYPEIEGAVAKLSRRAVELGERHVEASAQIAALGGNFRTLGERIASAEGTIANYPEIEGAVAKLSRRIAELSERDAEALAQIDTLAGTLRTLGSEVASAREDSKDLAGRLVSAEGVIASYPEIEGAVAKLNRRTAELSERDKEASTQIAALGENMRTLGSEIASARDASNKLAGRIASAEGAIASYPEIEGAVAKLNRRTAELGERDAESSAQIDALSGNLRTLGSEVASVCEDSKDIAVRLRSAESRLATYPQLEATVGRLDTRVAGLDQIEKSVAVLGRRDVETSSRLNALANDFQALSKDISSASERSAENLRGLQERVAGYSRVEAAVETLGPRIAGLDRIEESIAVLGKSDAEASSRIEALSDSLETLTAEISSVRKESSGLAERMRSAEGNMVNRPAFDSTLETLSKRVEGLDKIEDSFAQLSERNDESTRQIQALTGNFQAFTDKISSTTEQLAERMRSVEERMAGQSKLETAVETLGKRMAVLDRIEKSVTDLDGRDAETKRLIDVLSGDLKTLGNEIASAHEDAGKLTERLSLAEARIVAPPQDGKAIADLHARLETLEQTANEGANHQLASFEQRLESIASQIEQDEHHESQDAADIRLDVSKLEQLLNDTIKSNRDVLTELRTGLREMANRVSALEERGVPAHETAQPAAPVAAPVAAQAAAPAAAEALPEDHTSHEPEAVLEPAPQAADPEASVHDTPEIDPPPYLGEGELPPFEGFDSQPVLDATEGAAAADAAADAVVPDYLARARRAALSAAEKAAPGDASPKHSMSAWTSGEGQRKDRLPSMIAAGVGALFLISVAGYFLIPRGTTPTVEIAAQPGGSTQTNAPEPQAGSTFDQAVARANTGDARAMLSLSLAYAGGIGVERSDSEAQMWLERAAQAGEPVAQFQFGVGYEKGIGVAADPKQAAHWYLESATHGNVKAMYNLGVSYANGTGIEKNLAEAAHWFQSAAELGLTDAQFNLAVLYEHGLGVDASLADAYKWYAIAATGGDMDSKARTEALATQIPSAQKDAADQAIAAFKPQPAAPEVNEAPAPAGATTP